MAIGRFVAFNIAGACLWAGLVLGLGLLQGKSLGFETISLWLRS
jgi:membrane protein DedA with SNARE-associated domain